MHFRAVAHNPHIFFSKASHRFSLPTFCDDMRPLFRGRGSNVPQILNHDRHTHKQEAQISTIYKN